MVQIKDFYNVNIQNKDTLYRIGFRRDNFFSDTYIHKFPVYKNNGRTLIWGKFVVFAGDGIMSINAVDTNDFSCPFNHVEYGKSDVIEIVNKNMCKEINKLTKEGIINE